MFWFVNNKPIYKLDKLETQVAMFQWLDFAGLPHLTPDVHMEVWDIETRIHIHKSVSNIGKNCISKIRKKENPERIGRQ